MFPRHEEGGLATYRAALVQNQHLTVLAEVGRIFIMLSVSFAAILAGNRYVGLKPEILMSSSRFSYFMGLYVVVQAKCKCTVHGTVSRMWNCYKMSDIRQTNVKFCHVESELRLLQDPLQQSKATYFITIICLLPNSMSLKCVENGSSELHAVCTWARPLPLPRPPTCYGQLFWGTHG